MSLRNSARAFTLIEITVAVILIGLLAGAAMFSFSNPLRAMRTGQAIQQIAQLDASCRQAARRNDRDVEMVFNLPEGWFVRRELVDREVRIAFREDLPRGFRIEQATLATRSFSDTASIRCSPQGITPTYALRLVGPEFDRWLLFAGLSGQMTMYEDESKVQDIFTTLSRGNAD